MSRSKSSPVSRPLLCRRPRGAEPAVEERVAAGGQHRHHVEGEEEEVVVGPARQRHLESTAVHFTRGTVNEDSFTSKSSKMLIMFNGSQQTVKTSNMQSRMMLLYLEFNFLRRYFNVSIQPVRCDQSFSSHLISVGIQDFLTKRVQNLDIHNQAAMETYFFFSIKKLRINHTSQREEYKTVEGESSDRTFSCTLLATPQSKPRRHRIQPTARHRELE